MALVKKPTDDENLSFDAKKDNDSVSSALRRLDAADEMARSVYVDRPYLLAKMLKLREFNIIP